MSSKRSGPTVNRRAFQRGFTLIELLVSIAIIAALIMLLLPAVQQAREAARRIQCRNNLKQIGLALLNYEGVYKGFPPSLVNGPCRDRPGWGPLQHGNWSWRAQLLPYFEQRNLHDGFDFRQDSVELEPEDRPLLSKNVQTYLCPDDPESDKPWVAPVGFPFSPMSVALANYFGVQGSERLIAPVDYCETVAQPPTRPEGNGAFKDINTSTTLKEITDGASNTLFVGERPTDDYWGWWPVGTGIDGLGLLDFVLDCSEGLRDGEQGDSAHLYHFWSQHPGGAHFLMCDGSVHFLSYSINHPTFLALGTRAGGEVVGEF